MTEVRPIRPTTRARVNMSKGILDPTLLELERLLVTRLEDLDLTDPANLNLYNQSVTLLEHIAETLDYAQQENSRSGALQSQEEAEARKSTR
jgi:hypothetical protein